MGEVTLVGGDFLRKLLWVNVGLAVFNMIPAFPMDGGRVLRALLAMRLDYVRATQTAATVGQVLALGFGFVGLFTNPFLVFIALFVWMGATGEASMVQMKSSLAGIPVSRASVSDVMRRAFEVADPAEMLEPAFMRLQACECHALPVVREGRIVGMLTMDNVGELMMVQAAVRQARVARAHA